MKEINRAYFKRRYFIRDMKFTSIVIAVAVAITLGVYALSKAILPTGDLPLQTVTIPNFTDTTTIPLNFNYTPLNQRQEQPKALPKVWVK